jgi:hypothetical protein
MLTEVKKIYITENLNRTMQFNQQNLFEMKDNVMGVNFLMSVY